MLLYTSKDIGGRGYFIGVPTLLVWISYAALLIPLSVTLVWVFVEKWRMTHRLGRFLCAWFWFFVVVVIAIGFAGLSKGDSVPLA